MDAGSLPEGYTVRHPTRADAPEVAALIATSERANGDEATTTTEELLNDWEDIDLDEEAVLLLAPDGRFAAYADVLNRRNVQVSVYGYVHPDFQGQGLGAHLVQWGESWTRDRIDRAPESARVTVQHYVRESNAAARRLMESRGYTPVRSYYRMAIELDALPPAPVWPEGIALRTFIVGQDEQAVYEVGEETFSDIWGRPSSTYERWIAPTQAEEFDPSLWFLAIDGTGGEIAGFCLCRAVGGKGHVNTVGVRRPWRRKGLGLALLHQAFGEFFRRGVREVELSVDAESLTGAPRLYTRAGMHVASSYVLYRKALREGEDLAVVGEG